jgi:hypothetical protein
MRYLTIVMLFVGLFSSANADLLVFDDFSNGVLQTGGVNGGFNIIGTGSGEVEETDGVARITNSSNQNDTYGIMSSNTVSLSAVSGATSMITTWSVSNSDLKDKKSTLAFTWQTQSSLTANPEIGVLVDVNNTNAILYVDNTNNILGQVELDVNFGAPGDDFSLITTFTSSGFIVEGTESLRAKENSGNGILFVGTWGVSPKTFENYHLGAVISAKGNSGLVVDLDAVLVDAVPEPAVVGLIGVIGIGMIFLRRIFGSNNSDFSM